MTTDIKDLCKRALELDAKETTKPWRKVGDDNWGLNGFPQVECSDSRGSYFLVHDNEKAHFIAESRTLLPTIAQAYLELAERVEELKKILTAYSICDGKMCSISECINHRHLSKEFLEILRESK